MPKHRLSSYFYWLAKLYRVLGLRGVLPVLWLIFRGSTWFKVGELAIPIDDLERVKILVLFAESYREGRIRIRSAEVARKLIEAPGLVRMSNDYKIVLGEDSCSYCVRLAINNGELVAIMPDGSTFLGRYVDPHIFAETFFFDIHFIDFDLSGCLVVDIGAFVGDTAIYYARRGARVIAVEPVPTNYKALISNIDLNPGVERMIIPLNVAIAEKTGNTEISYNEGGYVDGGASIYVAKRSKATIRSYTLRDLLEHVRTEYGIGHEEFRCKILKMDCKGCEYYVINNEEDILNIFDIIKVEYSGDLIGYTVERLLDKLDKLGYRCRVWAHHPVVLEIGLEKHGTLTCFKK